MPSGVHRIGGGSLQWHARISEFMAEDFANWPFSKSELKEHYAELYKFLEILNFILTFLKKTRFQICCDYFIQWIIFYQ
jgi:hypothetical protein